VRQGSIGVVVTLSFCAVSALAAPAGAQMLSKHQDEVILDNQTLGDELARRDAAERRAKYQGDSPFADDVTSDSSDGRSERRSSARETAFRPLALTINPLTLALGRFGLNVEYLPAPHHGIMVNPYYSSATLETSTVSTSYESFGGEIGYHFYTGSRGANGFFAGPSFVFTRTEVTGECVEVGCDPGQDVGFSTYGVAFDLGGQYVWDSGVTLGAGGGLMYLKSSAIAGESSTIRFEGTVPRILFTLGYSI
jgi:hypothetical protein